MHSGPGRLPFTCDTVNELEGLYLLEKKTGAQRRRSSQHCPQASTPASASALPAPWKVLEQGAPLCCQGFCQKPAARSCTAREGKAAGPVEPGPPRGPRSAGGAQRFETPWDPTLHPAQLHSRPAGAGVADTGHLANISESVKTSQVPP